MNVPIGILAIILGIRWFPKPLFRRPPQTTRDGAQSPAGWIGALDPIGSVLLGLALLAILYPFMEARGSTITWALLPVGIALVWLWVLWEKRCPRHGHTPMVDLNIFRTRSFTNGTLIMTLYFMGMTSIWVIIAMYMQEGYGYSALAAGLIGIPAAVISAYAAYWAGDRVDVYGRKIVIAGLMIGIAGMLLSIAVVVLQQSHGISIWWLLLSLTLVGVAQGSVISPNQTLTLAEVPIAYAGSSGAIMQTGQRIGTSMGIAMITALAFATLAVSSWSVAFIAGFAGITAVVLITLAIAYADQRRRAGRPGHAPSRHARAD
mgnify:CR=1 FL=1